MFLRGESRDVIGVSVEALAKTQRRQEDARSRGELVTWYLGQKGVICGHDIIVV